MRTRRQSSRRARSTSSCTPAFKAYGIHTQIIQTPTIVMDMNNTPHIHTPDCIAVNELNEFCCSVEQRATADCCRRTVELHMPDDHADDHVITVHTFTDDDADAIALAVAHTPNATWDNARVTFRDTDHRLDEHAHFGYILDVPNPD